MSLKEGKYNFKNNTFLYYYSLSSQYKLNLLLLHGYSFNSSVWEKINIISKLERLNINIYAFDIPGFPHSRNKEDISLDEKLDLLNSFINRIGEPFVVLGASAGGFIAIKLSFLSNLVSNLILVGAVGLETINIDELKPSLFIWGENDNISKQIEITNKKHKVYILSNASHACYLDKPMEFNDIVIRYLLSLS